MQLEVSAANMQVTIFIVIMQMVVSVAIMQVVFSAVHYEDDCFRCNYAGDSFFYSYIDDSFKQFHIPFSDMTASFHKIDQKTFESIISGLHFTTLVKILPKLRYFESRNDKQIGYKSYSVLLFSL